MYCRVLQLYENNVKRSDREIDRDPGVRGVLMGTGHAAFGTLNVVHVDDSAVGRPRLLIPTLYAPMIITTHNDCMIVHGFQILGPGGAPVQQQLSIQFLARAPPPEVLRIAAGRPGHRRETGGQ